MRNKAEPKLHIFSSGGSWFVGELPEKLSGVSAGRTRVYNVGALLVRKNPTVDGYDTYFDILGVGLNQGPIRIAEDVHISFRLLVTPETVGRGVDHMIRDTYAKFKAKASLDDELPKSREAEFVSSMDPGAIPPQLAKALSSVNEADAQKFLTRLRAG